MKKMTITPLQCSAVGLQQEILRMAGMHNSGQRKYPISIWEEWCEVYTKEDKVINCDTHIASDTVGIFVNATLVIEITYTN